MTNPNGQPEPEEVNAYKADDSGKLTVIVQPQDFRLPEVLRHIEAGKIVLVIPQHNGPASRPAARKEAHSAFLRVSFCRFAG